MEKIEIVNCPENIESIEVIIELESPVHHRNLLQSVKRKIFKYKWEIAAGFVILCVVAVVLCVYFFTESDSRSETQTTTTAVIEAFDIGIASTTPTTTTATAETTTNMMATRMASDLDQILDPM